MMLLVGPTGSKHTPDDITAVILVLLLYHIIRVLKMKQSDSYGRSVALNSQLSKSFGQGVCTSTRQPQNRSRFRRTELLSYCCMPILVYQGMQIQPCKPTRENK